MKKILEILRRKPFLFIVISAGYLFGLGFLKWGIHPTTGTAAFLIGGALGMYFLDFAETVAAITPSPFRSIVFIGGLGIVSLFILTSSGSMLASGLVLSLFLTMILWQAGEWELKKNLNDWYRMVAGPVTPAVQQWIFRGTIAVFIIESLIFIR